MAPMKLSIDLYLIICNTTMKSEAVKLYYRGKGEIMNHEITEQNEKKRSSKISKKLVSLMAMMVVIAAFISVGYCTTPPPTLSIEFDTTQMFSWTQIIIGALMPVVYVLMGIGLGFLIINNLKHAFMGTVH